MTDAALAGYGVTNSFDGPPDYARHNAGITPKFHIQREPIVDENGQPTMDATGKPREYELEICTQLIAGDACTEVVGPAVINGTPMSPHIRFQEQYCAWKRGEETSTGTRLTDWSDPLMTPRLIRDFSFVNVSTVEDMGAISDSNVTRIIDGRMWRNKAIEWLRAHPKPEEEGEVQKLKAQNSQLLSRLEALEKRESVRARMEQVRTAKKANAGVQGD